MEFKLRPRARKDLRAIWSSSNVKFGSSQADRYITLINEKMRLLAKTPAMGSSRDEIKPGYKSFRVESHTIFFKREAYGISVLRVLYKGMDYPAHL